MRYSANLNVIIKSLEKATAHMSRDFIELENLQSNASSADRFAASCYNRAKQILVDDFTKIRPEYNIIFSDGQKIIRKADAEYTYIVHVVDGFDNLRRSNPDFTVAVALEHSGANGQKEAISIAISKIFGNEVYYCEKGFGAYLNNRRIRVSKRTSGEILVASDDKSLLGANQHLRSYGCKTLEIAYVASARLEKAIFRNDNFQLFKPFSLLVREAGGKISEDEKLITISAS
jgi:myo-inositol-1(or 4)-monophosphatase